MGWGRHLQDSSNNGINIISQFLCVCNCICIDTVIRYFSWPISAHLWFQLELITIFSSPLEVLFTKKQRWKPIEGAHDAVAHLWQHFFRQSTTWQTFRGKSPDLQQVTINMHIKHNGHTVPTVFSTYFVLMPEHWPHCHKSRIGHEIHALFKGHATSPTICCERQCPMPHWKISTGGTKEKPILSLMGESVPCDPRSMLGFQKTGWQTVTQSALKTDDDS